MIPPRRRQILHVDFAPFRRLWTTHTLSPLRSYHRQSNALHMEETLLYCNIKRTKMCTSLLIVARDARQNMSSSYILLRVLLRVIDIAKTQASLGKDDVENIVHQSLSRVDCYCEEKHQNYEAIFGIISQFVVTFLCRLVLGVVSATCVLRSCSIS